MLMYKIKCIFKCHSMVNFVNNEGTNYFSFPWHQCQFPTGKLTLSTLGNLSAEYILKYFSFPRI